MFRMGMIGIFLSCVTGIFCQAVNCPQNPQPDCCFKQGEILQGCKCKPTYNIPAAINVSNKWCGCYTAFIDASFLYWYAKEEGLELATNNWVDPADSSSTLPTNGVLLSQTFDYKPGFKVGAGIIGSGEWVLAAEYTWVRQTNTLNQTPPPSFAPPGLIDTWDMNSWYLQTSAVGIPLQTLNTGSTWKLRMDLVDLNLGRPYYQGRSLTLSPFAGLEGAFIRQSFVVTSFAAPITDDVISGQPILSVNRSNSWAVGPKAGCKGYCLFSSGFRLEGTAAASILYTRYTTIAHKENSASVSSPIPFNLIQTDYDCLRPVAEMGLGLGWGSYFNCQNYHFDFSASYDFLIFWRQNVMARLTNLSITSATPALDLFLHGLTVTTRFDF